MQGKKKNFKQTTVGKKILFIAVGLIALTGGVLMRYEPASDFTLVPSEQHNWQDLKGQWVVLNYFAPWCAPCLNEMPQLNQFAKTLPEQTRLFIINYDPTDNREALSLKKKYNIEAPMIISLPPPRMPVAPPAALPATYLINPNGEVVKRIHGEITDQSLRTMLKTLQSQSL